MFVKADLDEIGLNTFKWMPYAQNLVCFDSIPSVVPTNIILGLKKNIGEIYEQGKAHPDRVEPGTRIQVTDGPFKGYTGVFDAHLDEHERVKILLDLIDHKQMPVKLNRGQIAPRI
jgi:transcription antitermination factor NusG